VEAIVGRDDLGRTTGLVRIQVEVEDFVDAACQCLDIERDLLASGARTPRNSRLRWLVAGVGAERWRTGTKALALLLGRKPVVVTNWIARAARERRNDLEFATAYEQLDNDLAFTLAPTDQPGGGEP
jgi:hypothetical protein